MTNNLQNKISKFLSEVDQLTKPETVNEGWSGAKKGDSFAIEAEKSGFKDVVIAKGKIDKVVDGKIYVALTHIYSPSLKNPFEYRQASNEEKSKYWVLNSNTNLKKTTPIINKGFGTKWFANVNNFTKEPKSKPNNVSDTKADGKTSTPANKTKRGSRKNK